MRNLVPILGLTFATACTGAATLDAAHPLQLLVGAEGGSVQSDGVQIDVPAGALSADTTLTAYPKDRVVNGITMASQTWTFGPNGTTFSVPITVKLAFTGQHDAATVWWTKAGDLTTFTHLPTTHAGGWAIAKVTHFSEGAVGDDGCETSDNQVGDTDDGESADDASGHSSGDAADDDGAAGHDDASEDDGGLDDTDASDDDGGEHHDGAGDDDGEQEGPGTCEQDDDGTHDSEAGSDDGGEHDGAGTDDGAGSDDAGDSDEED